MISSPILLNPSPLPFPPLTYPPCQLQSLGMQQLEVEMLEKQLSDGVDEELHLVKPLEHEEINPKESTTWCIGTVVFVSGSLFNFASYSLAPQSLLASLESIQFVTNVIFGAVLLGKEITRRMYMGTALTVFGTILAILFSPSGGVEIDSIGSILRMWTNPVVRLDQLFYHSKMII